MSRLISECAPTPRGGVLLFFLGVSSKETCSGEYEVGGASSLVPEDQPTEPTADKVGYA